MENPQRPDQQGLLAAVLLLIALASLIASAFEMTRSNDLERGNLGPFIPRTSSCEAHRDVLGSAGASVRASTETVPWKVFNQQSSLLPLSIRAISAENVPGGDALRFTIPRAGRESYDIGISMLNARPVKAGDVVQARIWLKSNDAPGSLSTSGVPVLVDVRIQNNEPGFRRFFDARVSVTNVFQEYGFTAIAPKDYCSDELNVAVHLATGRHTIDVGPGSINVKGIIKP